MRRIERREQRLLGLEPEVDRMKISQATQEEAGPDHESQRESDLRDDQAAAQGASRASGLSVGPAFFQRGCEIRPAGAERGEKAEQESRQNGEQRRKPHYAHVGRDIELDIGSAALHNPKQRSRPKARRQQPEAAAQKPQQQGLRDELTNQPPASGAKSEPHSDLASPSRRPRQEQIGQVRAGDE